MKKNNLKLLITKITISSIVIGLKNSYFPLIHLPSCLLSDRLLSDSLLSDSSTNQSNSKL